MELKKLLEKKNELSEKINGYFTKAEAETRALNETEAQEVRALMDELKNLNNTIKMYEETRAFSGNTKTNPANKAIEQDKSADMELRAFANLIRTGKENYTDQETRSAVNMTVGANGAVIPKTIANKIIETVENICPIYARSTHFNVNGELVFPKYDESTGAVTMALAAEFTELEAKVGKFTEIKLSGYLAGCLALISRSLINNVEFDLTGYVVSKVALAIARYYEKNLLLGTGSNAMTGVCVAATQKVTAASATAITADELIDLQLQIPQVYQAGACWIMNTKTLAALRKLKNADGDYLLTKDLTNGFGFALLGKPVFLSDNMADIAAKAIPIVYGDLSGVYVNQHGNMELQVLLEKYATQHATGVTCWIEADSKLVEVQKVATLVMAAS